MIKSFTLRDFKGHRESTIPLGRLTLLVGPNGSGKTSVLEALWLQSQLVHDPATSVLKGDWATQDFLRRGCPGPTVFETAGSSPKQDWVATFTFAAGNTVSCSWRMGDAESETGAPNVAISAAIGLASLYQLDGAKIASAAYSDVPQPEVERDGTNTAVALASLKLGYDEAFARVEDAMRRLIPNVQRVRIRQAKVERRTPHVAHMVESVLGSKVYFDFKGAPDIPAHAASEGTLITLALLTVLHSPNRPNLLLLDDFDRSLHPQAQMEFVRVIKQLLDEQPDVQIVATTHSPYMLDEVDPSDVHVFALGDDDTVVIKRLSDHPDAEKMKGALSAGQLWSMDPERDWVPAGKAP